MKNILFLVCICWYALTSCTHSGDDSTDNKTTSDSLECNEAGMVQIDQTELINQIMVSMVDECVGTPDDGVFIRYVASEQEANEFFESLCGGVEIIDCYKGTCMTRKAQLKDLGMLIMKISYEREDTLAEMTVNIRDSKRIKKVIFVRKSADGEVIYQRGNLGELDY